MIKRLSILLAAVVVMLALTGCGSSEPITLDEKFYGSNEFIPITADELAELEDSESNFVLYTYNDNCTLIIPMRDILDKYMEKSQISMYSIRFEEFKGSFLNEKVKYAPSVIIVSDGKIVKFLNAEDDDDYDYFKSTEKFGEWFETYVVTTTE